ncbi:MAG: hypothetical protein QNJ01_08320 [Desulfobacterales bacterium]|nr:hypothetical protein [Desulfobacterales bacterium]
MTLHVFMHVLLQIEIVGDPHGTYDNIGANASVNRHIAIGVAKRLIAGIVYMRFTDLASGRRHEIMPAARFSGIDISHQQKEDCKQCVSFHRFTSSDFIMAPRISQ